MKWVSLLKDIKEKVGLSQTPAASPVSGSSSSPFSSNENVQSARQDFSGSPSRDLLGSSRTAEVLSCFNSRWGPWPARCPCGQYRVLVLYGIERSRWLHFIVCLQLSPLKAHVLIDR
ncbi:hypothetical protein CK203_002516 [Vitis vinifera]|uniref:Uncharacterized protein n=1 Tax=Vitis vinifera TaxID=29760 RepID=A0A438KHT9_VITVI|nr:hypothetical protein CK203_002516 [Vitis vinifera]